MYKIILTLLLSVFLSGNLYAQEITKENLAKLYVATFDRAPDSDGLDYWLDSSFTLEQVAMSFFDQEETQAKYPPSNTNAQFIKTIYQNLFDRDPDDKGSAYWLKELDEGLSRSVFILATLNGALGDDAVLLDNKTEVGLYFADKGLNDYQLAIDVMAIVTVDSDSVVKAKEMIDGADSTKNLIRYLPPEEVKSFPFDFEQIDGYDSSMDKSMLVGEINNQYWIRAFNRLTEAEIREVVAPYNTLTPVGYSDAHGLLVEIPVGDAEAIDALAKIELTRGITSVRKRMYLGSGLIKIQSLHKIESINDLPDDGGSPLDDSEGDNWHLGYINMAKAWTITTGSEDVWVGVVDDGFYPYHEDLCNKSKIIPPFKDPQCLDSDSIGLLRTMKKYKHGTAVVGIIAAHTNNSIGITGINWYSKVVVASNIGEEDESIKTIEKDTMAVEKAFKSIFFEQGEALTKVKLVNNSWGLDYWTYIKEKGWVLHTYYKKSETNAMKCNRPLKEIMEKYPKKLFVYASGNYAMDAIKFNGIFHKDLTAGASNLSTNLLSSSNDNILIVGSVLNDGTLPYSSNYGDSVDIVAPTSMKSPSIVIVGISTYLKLKSDNSPYYGTYHENTESLIFNGTSAAAPVVTGVASLIYSLNPDFTPQEVKKILINSATKFAKKRHTTIYYETNITEKIPAGHDIPILDAGAALQLAQDIMNGKIVNIWHYYPSFFSPECRIFISSSNQKLNLERPVLAVRGQRVDNDTLEAIDSNSLPNIESMSVRSFNTNRIYKKYIIEGYVSINGITNATRFKNEFEDIKVVPVTIRDKATGEAINGAKITVESMHILNYIAKLLNRGFYEEKTVDGDTIDLYLKKDQSYRIIVEKEGYKKSSEIYMSDLASFTVEMESEGYVPGSASAIKKTGQTKSYNQDGDEVTDGSVKDDGHYQKGVAHSYSRDDSKEIVTDHITGLMWQDNESIEKPWVTQANYDARNYFDTSGDTATIYCASLDLGDYTDWRLPTIKELESIIDYDRYDPAISSVFVHVGSDVYWSSTTAKRYHNNAWIVYFHTGLENGSGHKYGDQVVRCVRAGE